MDITAIMTAHREGALAGMSIISFEEAILAARARGYDVEPLVVLDRTDDLTRSVFEASSALGARLVESDVGDPAFARNLGAQEATGRYISFLDADDFWSENWLWKAMGASLESERPTVWHSECNVVFGNVQHLWFHVDSEDVSFDSDFLRVDNHWDAMSFSLRQIFIDTPFVPNQLASGYGHEDWHWNCLTLAQGISHRPVPGTIHAKRRRQGSQSARCSDSDVIIWPNPITSYAWLPPAGILSPLSYNGQALNRSTI